MFIKEVSPVDRLTGIFADGIGAAAATSGILTQLQGRIFGLLYLQPEPLSLDQITDELQQSKSNVSVQIRGLVDWQLVRQVRVAGSRKDHYAAATDFWRVMQEILERRFRWNLRQVLATVEEAEREVGAGPSEKTAGGGSGDFAGGRLTAMRDYFLAVDAGLSAFSRGEPMAPEAMRDSVLSRIPIEEVSGPGQLRQSRSTPQVSTPRLPPPRRSDGP
jgi:DNA-binding transcriptional regulator GbsR (MarR family)